ncbi:MAG: ATP-binding cassette domain-containing protein [Winogradskyella sp.]
MIFELDNVELYLNNTRILHGIYLKGETGKVTSILGQNGCGKSSLMNIAFGNLQPKYKLVRINNTPILKPLYKTGLVKFLPQYNFIPKSMKLSYAFNLFKIDWNDFIMNFEPFENYKNSRLKELSGGERRIVETYIILKSESKIVFLDEPFSHIAPLHIEKIKQLIILEKAHKIMIISDHMYKHVIDCSDDIYLLKNGTTKKIGNLSELEDYKYLSEGTL